MGLKGHGFLQLLLNTEKLLIGDSINKTLIRKFFWFASVPYMRLIEQWIFKGQLNDPWNEGLIIENTQLHLENLLTNTHATYWFEKFRVVSDRPTFVGDLAFDILAAGKNLQIIRDSREKEQRIKYIAIVDTIKIKSSLSLAVQCKE